jgi:hypothetical protein
MDLDKKIKKTISNSNIYIINKIREMLPIFRSNNYNHKIDILEKIQKEVKLKHSEFKVPLDSAFTKIEEVAEGNVF